MAKIIIRVIDAYVFRKTKEGIKYLILKRAKTTEQNRTYKKRTEHTRTEQNRT